MTALASPIDWPHVQQAIHDWLANATGLEVAWAKQPRRPQGAKAFAILQFQNGPDLVQYDAMYRTFNATTGMIDRTVAGQREFTIQAEVFTDDCTPNGHAINYMARAQMALQTRAAIKALKTTGDVAAITSTQIQDLTAIAGADWESRAAMDVVFRVAANLVTSSVAPIAKASLAVKLDTANDSQLVLTGTITNP